MLGAGGGTYAAVRHARAYDAPEALAKVMRPYKPAVRMLAELKTPAGARTCLPASTVATGSVCWSSSASPMRLAIQFQQALTAVGATDAHYRCVRPRRHLEYCRVTARLAGHGLSTVVGPAPKDAPATLRSKFIAGLLMPMDTLPNAPVVAAG